MIMQKKRKLTLHIGLPKTGSSTIQTFLHTQHRELTKQSIETPQCLGAYSHYKLALMFYSTNHKLDFLAKNNNLDSAHKRLQFKAELEYKLKGEIESKTTQKWIISSEFLQHTLQAEHEITSLAEMLREYFKEINLLLYVRKPIRAAISMMSTEVKMGKPKFGIESPAYYRNLCNHKKTITMWQRAFQPDHLKVSNFDELQQNGKLLQDFCEKTDIAWREAFDKTPRSNQSLSVDGLQIITSLNRYMIANSIKVQSQKRFRFIDHVIKNCQGHTKYKATKEQAIGFSNYYHASDTWLKQTLGINYLEKIENNETLAQHEQYQMNNSKITDEEALEIWRQWNERINQASG
ncbi:hypothetical protein [Synechococcus sp. PROS-7-1]|uniref:hypothetical protein n=1 Tax=Synechococcus sp. PROS-7-1 TaxID=1442556 RepID=UPI001CA42AE3|nr:hypothetical protein [Synechococcus sp. PROS-7-1]